MNQGKLKSFIEAASNIAVVVVAVVVLASFARSYLRATPRVVLQGGLLKGSQFPQLPGVDFRKSQKTLLVAMDSKCDYCSESLPFYKNLADSLRGRSNDARMIAVFPSAEEETKRYAQQSQLNVDTIFGLDFKMLNLSALPAMILIDNNGRLLDFWIGKPSKDTEKQILNRL